MVIKLARFGPACCSGLLCGVLSVLWGAWAALSQAALQACGQQLLLAW